MPALCNPLPSRTSWARQPTGKSQRGGVVGRSAGHYIDVSLRIDRELRNTAVAVRIRMKQMGRTHRHYYRIVAIDHRQPRDGRAIEELGTYDPHVPNPDNAVTLRPSRIKYWKSVGAKASEHCEAIFQKHMAKWEGIEAKKAAEAATPAAQPAPQ